MPRREENNLIEISAIVRHQTEKGILLYDGAKEAWFAKDLVEDNRDGTFTMPEWLAKKEGFI